MPMTSAGENERKSGRLERQKAQRRELILDIAQAMFLEQGYGQTTMSAIASVLQGSKSTLWTYFPNKEALFAAVLNRAAVKFRQKLCEALKSDSQIEVTIRKFCSAYIRILCAHEAISIHRLVISEAKRFPDIGRIFFNCAVVPTRDLLLEFFGSINTGKLTSTTDPMRAAHLLAALCHGHCFRKMIFGLADHVTEEEMEMDAELAATSFLSAFSSEAREL